VLVLLGTPENIDRAIETCLSWQHRIWTGL